MKLASLTLIFLMMSNVSVGVSQSQKSDSFDKVPSTQREQLKSRLTEFVAYHRMKQWEMVYDMLAERTKESHEGGLPKDLFLKQKRYSTVRKFTPKSVHRMDTDDAWIILGCGTYDDSDTIESVVHAYLQNGVWFFSDIWGDFPCVDCTPRRCKH